MPRERRRARSRPRLCQRFAIEHSRRRTILRSTRRRFENAWINEFLAPFQGLENVREAHGNRAAAELALSRSALSFPTRQSLRQCRLRRIAADANRRHARQSEGCEPRRAKPVEVNSNSPYFAHLAMCRVGKPESLTPIQPPLGWVLSKATQDHFHELLEPCENDAELRQLEIALGKPAAAVSAPVSSPTINCDVPAATLCAKNDMSFCRCSSQTTASSAGPSRRLFTRNGDDFAARFPKIAAAIEE